MYCGDKNNIIFYQRFPGVKFLFPFKTCGSISTGKYLLFEIRKSFIPPDATEEKKGLNEFHLFQESNNK